MAHKERASWEQKLTPFLRNKLAFLKEKYGEKSREHLAIARQYLIDKREREVDYKAERSRHYEADMTAAIEGLPAIGIERLYRRVGLVELTTICLARCRWCLRANYGTFTLTEDEIVATAKYFGNDRNRDDIRELLITGGDPFLLPDLVEFTIETMRKYAPNIQIFRVASRLFTQEPKRINEKMLRVLRPREGARIEVGTQINHDIELWEETRAAYKKIRDLGITIYNQQILLRGVNDDLDTLVRLYNGLREIGIEAHYMFHCCPIKGMSHHRTSVEEGLDLIKGLTSSGQISGRCKPMYTAMTDIGKVTLYEGVILDKKNDMILLQTKYLAEDRKRWNPAWNVPEAAYIDDDGCLRVWYKDGIVHDRSWPTTAFFNG
jgi:lysine 2,3-aminomutase